MTAPRSHKDLLAWKKAVALATKVYSSTEALQRRERGGLVNQMRRSAISVPSNIAEGAGRGTRAEYLRFLSIARGSLAELETQVFIMLDLRLIEAGNQLPEDISEVGRLLSALVRRLREHRSRTESRRPQHAAPPRQQLVR